jgi:hypothetical protein
MIYRAMPNLVSNIIMDGQDIFACAQAGIPRPLTQQEVEHGATVVPAHELSSLLAEFGLPPAETSDEENTWGWPRLSGGELQDQRGCVMRPGVEDGIPIWKLHA